MNEPHLAAPPSTADRPIVVLGGTGTTGRRVAARLRARGVPIRIGSRRGTPPFDWTDATTWPPVLRGAGAVYVAYAPDLAAPGAGETVAALATVAADHGVRRVVLLSGRGEPAAEAAEAAVAAIADGAGMAWTIVRAAWFTQNFSEKFLAPMVHDGVIALPAGAVTEPFVDADDVADVAVAALLDDGSAGHACQVYEVTGPRLVAFAEVASTISDALGRRVVYVPVTPEEFTAGAVAAGVAPEEATMLGDLFAHVLDGHNSHFSDGVQRALGRAPRDIADVIAAIAASGVWDLEAVV